MTFFRKIYRTFLLVGWILFIWLVLFIVRMGDRWSGQRRLAKASQLWGKGISFIFGIKIKINNYNDNFTSGLVVSNHTGYVDIFVQAGVWPTRFAAKDAIRTWPFIGWFVACGRPVWIDRTSRIKSKIAAQEIRDSMLNDISLIAYPEGTSTNGKDGMLTFKSTPFEAVIEGDNWIQPAVIRYGDTPDGKAIAWYEDMTLLPHLWRILGYKKIDVEINILKAFKPEGRNRKELAKFAQGVMEEEYKKMFASGPIQI